FDINPNPGIYGGFTDPGPIFDASTAYGRRGPGAPGNVTLTFRHPGRAIDIAYFDGHIGSMKSAQAWTDAAPWYPGGSIFNGTNGTPESNQPHPPGEVLP